MLAPAILDTATRALKSAGVEPTELASVIVDSTNMRAAAGLPAALGFKPEQLADTLAANVGRTGVQRTRDCCSLARSTRAGRATASWCSLPATAATPMVLELTERLEQCAARARGRSLARVEAQRTWPTTRT